LGLAIILVPEILSLSADRLAPRFRSGDSLLVLALIGTTIVPYNLFLHATACATTMAKHPVVRGTAGSKVGIIRRHFYGCDDHAGDHGSRRLYCWNRPRVNRCLMH
jgi:Mn2+/Fe2+ NRAMP family transporter